MLSIRQRITSAFLMGALVMAQIMGLRAGYLCECSEQEKPVTSASCHPEDCHPGMEHAMQLPASGAEEDEKGYPHSEQRDTLAAIGTFFSTQSMKPMLALDLGNFFASRKTHSQIPNLNGFAHPMHSRGHHPPDQLRMILSVVLLS